MSTSRAQPVQPVVLGGKPTAGAAPTLSPIPQGQESYKRWDLQHETHKRIIGGLYRPHESVQAALALKEGYTPRILDVGTGSGTWAVEMAREFPHCEVIGIDVVLPTSISSQPSNLKFQTADVTLPLPLETASIDFVHARMMDTPIVDYPKWISEVSRILRAGGVYYTFAATMKGIQEDGTELPTVPIGEEGYTGFQNFFRAIYDLPLPRWGDRLPHDDWTRWMEENGNFDKVVRDENLLEPVGPWQKDIDENTRIGSELMRDGLLAIIADFKPILLSAGHDEAVLDKWIEDATVELVELRVKVSSVWSSAWCVRSSNEWKPLMGTQ